MENLTPAIQSVNEKTLKELSPQEFQQVLSVWFHDKGIVQDMKSYLKFQMINVLQNTVIGKNIKTYSSGSAYSLSQQALHLIIAEYLLHYQCDFALSLFSSEVNIRNLLPETKRLFSSEPTTKKPIRFDKENLKNILEIVGICKDSQEHLKIISKYFESDENPLLFCILSLIGKEPTKAGENSQYYQDEAFEDDFFKNMRLVMQSQNLPHKTQTHLLRNLKVCLDLKNKSFEHQVVQLVDKFRKEIFARDEKLHHAQRRTKHLEKKSLATQEDNQGLRQQMQSLSTEEKRNLIESAQCSLGHCNEQCADNKKLCALYQKEIERLKDLSNQQKLKFEQLSSSYGNLLKEFESCQNKIHFVNARIEDVALESEKDQKESTSLSSNSITEEILQNARCKLKLLEDEGIELDIRFKNFVMK
ncbi:hypothetical protein HUJ04_010618 [Dendroctonus ponderosae]